MDFAKTGLGGDFAINPAAASEHASWQRGRRWTIPENGRRVFYFGIPLYFSYGFCKNWPRGAILRKIRRLPRSTRAGSEARVRQFQKMGGDYFIVGFLYIVLTDFSKTGLGDNFAKNPAAASEQRSWQRGWPWRISENGLVLHWLVSSTNIYMLSLFRCPGF